MQGNKASGKKGVQHGLDKGAVGSFLSRGASIGKEEATRGSGMPNSWGNWDTASGANTLRGNGEWYRCVCKGRARGGVGGLVIWQGERLSVKQVKDDKESGQVISVGAVARGVEPPSRAREPFLKEAQDIR